MLFRIAWALAVVLLALLLGLAAFVHPYADDLSYAVAGMRVPLLERLVHEYTSWNGRYASNALLLRGPMVLGLESGILLYRACAAGLLLLTWWGAFRLLRAWRPTVGGGHAAFVALLFVLLFAALMPDLNEGFYWYTGAMTYQLPNALSLFLLARWCGWVSAGRPARTVPWYAVQAMMIFFIAGCNEVHMALLLIGHVGWSVLTWRRQRRIDRPVLWMAVVAGASALIVFAAPGNATREALFPDAHDPFRTVLYSLAQTARFSAIWCFTTPLLIASLGFVIWDRQVRTASLVGNKRFSKWSSAMLPFLVVLVAMVVTYWPTGLLGQHRTVNAACFFFLMAWFRALSVWDGALFFPKRWPLPALSPKAKAWSVIGLVLTLAVSGPYPSIVRDLLNGRFSRYDQAMQDRYSLVVRAVDRGQQEPLVLPVVIPPAGLHILPLDTSPDHWVNRSLADYFGDAELRIKAMALPPPTE